MAYRTKVKGISEFLREKRLEHGITQLDASRALGHSTSQYISNFERGLCEPSLETALKLCELYKISKRDLYDLMVDLYQDALSKKMFAKGARASKR